ncbi:unnamed protein product, partial [Ectocarpus sp. 6 AP-2014]
MRAPDGTEFTDRAEYRKYLFLTQYTFKDREGEILRKLPGDIDGQPFDLTSLRRCEVALLDRSEAVQVDELSDCRVFIAACVDSVFVRNCTGCVFTVACKQLRTRDCEDCEFRLYCKTEPIIETSHGMTFAPFNGAYVGHAEHLREAGLTTPNLWFGVYDFNDEAKTGDNWRLLAEEEHGGEPWRPLNDNSEVAIPATAPGSVPLPSKRTGGRTGETSEASSATTTTTMAFSLATSAIEAEAAVQAAHHAAGVDARAPSSDTASAAAVARGGSGSSPPAAVAEAAAAAASRKAGQETSSAAPPRGVSTLAGGSASGGGAGSVGKIGWNPSRAATATAAAARVGNVGASERDNAGSVGKVGWDPSRATATAAAAVATTAGKPAAAGGGGGDAAPSSPQQQVEAEFEAGGGKVGWSSSRSGAAGSRGDPTETLPVEGRHQALLRPASIAEEGGEKQPSAQQQQQQPKVQQQESRQKIGWDPTRASKPQQQQQQQQQPRQKIGWSKSTTRSARAAAAGASASAPAAPNAGGSVATPESTAKANGGPHARALPPNSSSSATLGVTTDPAAKPRVGWNASRVGNQAVPAPLAAGDSTAEPPTAPEPATSGTAADKPTPRVGWNPSRIGNPAIPAPMMNCRASGAKEAEAASAVATAVTAAVAVAGRGATRRGGGGEGAVTVGNGDGGGGVVRRAEVPLHLRAVLLYASTQRGIDLRKWFDLGGGGDGEMEDEGQAGEKAAALLTRVQFELVLAGLAEGLKAGLSEEERREIDTAIAPQVIEAAVAAASATSGRSGACSSSSSSEGNNSCSVIDVGRLLDLCGIPPTTPLPPEAACPEPPPPRDSDPQESVGQDVVADIVEKAGPGAPGGSVYDKRGGRAAAKARVVAEVEAEVEADETALRRVAQQADLFDRVLASLGLKQPVVGSSQGSTLADWEASLRVSTVPLEAFRKGLAEVGLHLSRTRAIALATRACGPLHRFSDSAIGDDGTGRPRAGRRPNNNVGGGSARLGSSLSSGSSGSRIGTKSGQPRSVDRLSRRGGSRANLQRNSPQRQQQQRQQRDKGGNRRRRRPQEARGRTAARGDGGGGKRAPSLSSRRNGQAHPVLSPTTRWRSTPPAPSRTQSSPPQRNSSHGESEIPAWDLRRYLVRLRCESKSRQARCDQRRRRLRCNPTGQEEGCEDSEGSEEEREGGGGGGGGATGEGGVVEGDEDDAAALSVFAAWGKRIRWERAERERERKREFQSALAGRPHSLTLEQLLECVHRFEIMPPEVMSRELRAMGKAFSESVEGTRRAREIVRRWSQASPASRNACGTDGPEQKVWEDVQTLSGAQRRARACAIVAKQKEEELVESEDTSASVSRGLFLAYIRNSHGGKAGGRGGVSLQRWLEDRQAAMEKARELEAGRERAQALSKADTAGRKARQFF